MPNLGLLVSPAGGPGDVMRLEIDEQSSLRLMRRQIRSMRRRHGRARFGTRHDLWNLVLGLGSIVVSTTPPPFPVFQNPGPLIPVVAPDLPKARVVGVFRTGMSVVQRRRGGRR